jgi:glutathione synthase/RimK-type ligase-like ATP-grasp enzyme
VLKPIRANSGKWIVLTTVKELLKKRKKYIWLEELYIVQQYKNFNTWYPKICSTTHDVRFMFAGKKIIECTLRVPKKWDFRSNVWLWWTQHLLEKKQIPKELLSLTKKIYKKLDIDDTNIFSMDFAYCRNDKQRYLLETNATPWTWYYQTDEKKLAKICKWLATFFLSLKK